MGGWGGLSLPGGGIGSVPVSGVPASSGAGLPSQDQFLKFMQAMAQMQQEKQRGAGIASGAIAGIPMGAPTPPYGGGVTPGGPVAQAAQQRQQQPQGPVPSSTGGGSAFTGVVPRQAQPAEQIPYASTGKGAWAANAVYGVSNMLSRQRQEDQQKEYTTAENLWTQVLNAQQNIQNAANQGLDDPEDKARIKAILDDDKNRKIIQDALPGVLMTQSGDPSQQQETDPKKQAQQAGARGALQKLGRTIGGVFDPRTQAQRMPGGTTTPINTPGGAMWKFPEPTQEQKLDAAAKFRQAQGAAMITPQQYEQMAEVKGGIRLSAQAQSVENWRLEVAKSTDRIRQELADATKERTDAYKKAQQSVYDRNEAAAAKLRSEAGVTAQDLVYPGDPNYTGDPGMGPLPRDPYAASLVKQLTKYAIPYNSLSARATGPLSRNALMAEAGMYDNSFDAYNYNARAAYIKDVSQGKVAQNLTSLNRVANHFDRLEKAFAALNNKYGYDWMNRIDQIRKGVAVEGGYPALKQFDDAVQALSGEMTKLYTGTGSDVQQIRSWKQNMNASETDKEFQANMAELVNLVAGQMDALQGGWDRAMGSTARWMPFLTPQASAVFQRYGINSLSEYDRQGMQPKGNVPRPQAGPGEAGAEGASPGLPPDVDWTPAMKQMYRDDPSPMYPVDPSQTP